MKLFSVAVKDLVTDPNNARSHSEKNMEGIEDSIKDWGQLEPLVVQKSSMRVISGNARLNRFHKLKHTHVDVLLLDVDNKTADRMGLMFNRLPELGKWNDEIVASIMASADSSGEHVPGFSDADMRDWLEQISNEETISTGGDAGTDTMLALIDEEFISKHQEAAIDTVEADAADEGIDIEDDEEEIDSDRIAKSKAADEYRVLARFETEEEVLAAIEWLESNGATSVREV